VSSRRSRTRAPLPELNLTPLLDVIFNLLFFFILGTNLKSKDYAVEMKLPSSATASPAPSDESIPRITIARDGTLALDGERMESSALGAELKRLAESKNVTRAVLVGDSASTLQQLIAVTDLCRAAGIRQVSPRVEPAAGTPR